MKITFTQIFSLILFCFIFSCSPKPYFLFSENIKSLANDQSVNTKDNVLGPLDLTPEGARIDSILLMASAESGPLAVYSQPKEKIFLMPPPEVEYYQKKERPLSKIKELPAPITKLLLKKSIKTLVQVGEKPTHKLAQLSLALGLTSILFLLLVALIPTLVGVLSTIMLLTAIGALVTGKISLKEIKNNPDNFAGKGKALAGFIIGLLVCVFFLLFLILALFILALFFGGFN